MQENKLKDGWHLDKRVPVALILTLVVYGVTAVWMFAMTRADVESNSKDIAAIQRVQTSMQTQSVTQGNQLSRIEEQVIGLRRDITRFLGANK